MIERDARRLEIDGRAVQRIRADDRVRKQQDQRERANVAKRNPDKLRFLKQKYQAWEASLPPLPQDAKVSFIGGPADMAQPS